MSATPTPLAVLSDEERRKVESYLPLVHYVAQRYFSYIDHADAVQDGVFGVVRGVRGFTDGMGASEKSYVYCRIRGEIADCYRNRTGGRRQHQARLVVLSDAMTDVLAVEEPFGDVDLGDTFGQFVGGLSAREKAILGARAQGRTMSDIANEWGVTEARISQIVKRLGAEFERVAA